MNCKQVFKIHRLWAAWQRDSGTIKGHRGDRWNQVVEELHEFFAYFFNTKIWM